MTNVVVFPPTRTYNNAGCAYGACSRLVKSKRLKTSLRSAENDAGLLFDDSNRRVYEFISFLI
ncbi:MAG: hypothetical protein F4X32_07150 [Candidatus Dadabacteria bacterium]|nr:hypothetical protein [Candidatus Dadabacteria bacterium]MYB27254.1 hypothetical protein [Candidatus Dadabacteria bacterium]